MKRNSEANALTKKEQAQQKRLTPQQEQAKASGAASNAAANAAAASTDAAHAFPPAELDERMLTALHAASDKKAINLVALDLRAVASFTDYFLIASGTNQRQVQAIADEVAERLKKEGTRAQRIEGYKSAEWILVDYGDFIFHVFEEKARRFYDLERLWRDAGRVGLPPELASGGGSSVSRGDEADGDASQQGDADGSLRTEQ